MMNKFKPNQRVALNVNPSELVHVTCGGQQLSRDGVYHIKEYADPFNGQPMVRLRECGNTAYQESIFREAHRKRFVKQFERLSR